MISETRTAMYIDVALATGQTVEDYLRDNQSTVDATAMSEGRMADYDGLVISDGVITIPLIIPEA